MSEMKLVGTIIRDANTECKIKIGTYLNIEQLDIRWHNKDKPTIKGVRLNMKEAKLLLDILRRELE